MAMDLHFQKGKSLHVYICVTPKQPMCANTCVPDQSILSKHTHRISMSLVAVQNLTPELVYLAYGQKVVKNL